MDWVLWVLERSCRHLFATLHQEFLFFFFSLFSLFLGHVKGEVIDEHRGMDHGERLGVASKRLAGEFGYT